MYVPKSTKSPTYGDPEKQVRHGKAAGCSCCPFVNSPSRSLAAHTGPQVPSPFSLMSLPHLQLLLADEVRTKQGASEEPKSNHQVLGLIQDHQRSTGLPLQTLGTERKNGRKDRPVWANHRPNPIGTQAPPSLTPGDDTGQLTRASSPDT